MIGNSDFDEISDLILKDFLGIISSGENDHLNNLADKYGLTGRSCLDKKHISDKAFAAFANAENSIESKTAYKKFKSQTQSKHGPLNKPLFRYWNVAASILLILSIIYARHLSCPQSEDSDKISMIDNYYFNNLIVPNDNTPVIILSSGYKIPINNGKLEINESEGTSISVLKRELIYKSDSSGLKFPLSLNNLWNTLFVPSGLEYKVLLSDGSEIMVNSKSSIKFLINNTLNDRVVYLSGEAYFKVKNIDNKPFVVKTSKGDIRVLGTEFNVRDYNDEKAVVTTLEKGMVEYKPKDKRKQSVIILPGIQVIDDAGSNELKIDLVNTSLYTSWIDGKYIFEDTSLEEIIKMLEKWYAVKFIYDSKDVKQIHYTGVLKKYENIYSVLDFLETSEDISFQIFGETIIIKKRCKL